MKKTFIIFIAIYIIVSQAYAEDATNEEKILKEYDLSISRIDSQLKALDSIWLKRYDVFRNYHKLVNEINILRSKKKLTTQEEYRLGTIRRQVVLLKQYKDKPFGELLEKPTIPPMPAVTNPFAIFSALSYFKHIEQIKNNFTKNQQDLNYVLSLVKTKIEISNNLISNNLISNKYKEKYNFILANALDKNFELESAKKILETTNDVFMKDSEENVGRLKLQVKTQILKLFYILLIIIVSIAFALILKILVKKYVEDHEKAYTISKIINFANITVIFFILIFAYIDNATYALAFVGFISAGLAFAMKDLFMSMLGWLVILIGGSIHVGDRIRVRLEGDVFVGDVIDISILRISIYENVTLASYLDHRSGRIIFIPNNYIFTNLISNYTHGGLTNVWDSVEINITFESNIKKAKQIALEVASSHARVYTDQTRKQMQKMRDKYSIAKSTAGIEPRVFNFIKENGMQISVWFQNDAYATLRLKSIISEEIVQKYLSEPDIFVAYPITRILYKDIDNFKKETK